MKVQYSDLEMAFLFVSSGPQYENRAIINKKNGKIFMKSEMDEEHFPADYEYDNEKYLEIPHKNDLGLGRDLVFQFAEEYLPKYYEDIIDIFKRKGAYSRYKYFLESKGKLDEWYNYENEMTKKRLIEYMKEYKIEIEE